MPDTTPKKEIKKESEEVEKAEKINVKEEHNEEMENKKEEADDEKWRGEGTGRESENKVRKLKSLAISRVSSEEMLKVSPWELFEVWSSSK